jgi:hypothetical protein
MLKKPVSRQFWTCLQGKYCFPVQYTFCILKKKKPTKQITLAQIKF